MDVFKDVLELILFTVITGCGVVITKKLLSAFNTQIDKWQEQISDSKYETLNKYIDLAQNAIYAATVTISQTFVDSLKKVGKFDKEAQMKAKNDAVELAKELITEESKNAIETLHGNFDTYLASEIEKFVNQTK